MCLIAKDYNVGIRGQRTEPSRVMGEYLVLNSSNFGSRVPRAILDQWFHALFGRIFPLHGHISHELFQKSGSLDLGRVWISIAV